jgi:hypothetical protein
MSELSELIEINKNIQEQNEEIIRLLKIIAGEGMPSYVKMPSAIPEGYDEVVHKSILETTPKVGEVFFVEGEAIFRLSVKNNQTVVDNLNGSDEVEDYALQEMIAKESIKRNRSLDDDTVILSKENALNLPLALKVCYEEGAKNVFIPWSAMTQLVGAPENLMTLMKLYFYKSEEDLLEILFGGE